MSKLTKEQYLKFIAVRKEEGRKIDPETAEVMWSFADANDPYNIDPLPEFICVGRTYYARRPGSDTWVDFNDLPTATCDALWEKHKQSIRHVNDLPDRRQIASVTINLSF